MYGQVARENRPFLFFLYKLTMQSFEEFFLLRKHFKEGGNCHNPILGHSQILFSFSSKKKTLHGAVLNGTVQLLLPCKCRDRGEGDF
jgi:hypothetical protein